MYCTVDWRCKVQGDRHHCLKLQTVTKGQGLSDVSHQVGHLQSIKGPPSMPRGMVDMPHGVHLFLFLAFGFSHLVGTAC